MNTISFRFGRYKCADELNDNNSNNFSKASRKALVLVCSVYRRTRNRGKNNTQRKRQIQNPRRQLRRKIYRQNSGRIRCDSGL